MRLALPRVRPWICWILTLIALLLAAPREARAGTFNPATTQKILFSLSSSCDDSSGVAALTVVAGTPVWVCHRFQNLSSTYLFSVQMQDPQAPVGTSGTVPPGFVVFAKAKIIATATTTYTFTVTGRDTAGNTFLRGPDHATLTVVSPALQVEKTVSTSGVCPGSELVTVLSGAQVTTCYKVTNAGNTAVNGAVITDGGLTLSVGNLAVGQSASASHAATALADSTTTAVASGTDSVTSTPVASPPDGAAVDVIAPALTVAATVSTNGVCPGLEVVNVLAGTGLTWCYSITNTGDSDIKDVTVADDFFGAAPGGSALLAPGQSFTLGRADSSTLDTTVTAFATGTTVATSTAVRSNEDPAAVNVVGPHVDIDVTISTNGVCPGADVITVPVGTSARYCYLVSNAGDDELHAVDVVNEVNDFLGTIPVLEVGGSATIVGAPFLVQGDAVETATATATDPYGFGVFASDTAKVHALFPGLQIQKTVSTDGTCPGSELVTVLSGAQITTCYAVTNTGGTSLNGVTVDDNGVTVAAGDLAPGQSVVVSASTTATSDAGTSAVATGATVPTGAPFSSAPDAATVDVISPALVIEKTASTDGICPGGELVTVLSGAQVTYCYTVTNTGDTAVSGVVVDDSGAAVTLGDLLPGQSQSGAASVTATADTDTPATASGVTVATGTPVSSSPDDAAIDVVAPALSIQKTASSDGSCPGSELVTILAGSSVAYCYVVTNNGDVAISGITLTDNGTTIAIGDLAAGQSSNAATTFTANADESTPAVAQGICAETGTTVESPPDGAAVVIVAPSLSIEKTASVDGTCPGSELVTVLSGAPVTYCYAVTNTGDTAIGSVVVDDGGVTIAIGDLAPGQSGNGSAGVIATADTSTAATASGTTTATGTPVSSPPDAAGVDVISPALAIEKTASTGGTCPGSELITVLSGAQVTYCYKVTNTGDTAVSGVVVNDSGAAVTLGDLLPGQSSSGSTGVIATVDTATAATASGTTTATGTAVSSAPDSAAVDVVAPALAIQKTVSVGGACPGAESVTVLAGVQVTYCYAVTNTGDTPVGDVVIADDGQTLSIGNLGAGQSGGGTIVVTAVADTAATATASGLATATGTPVASPPDGAAIDVITPALSIATTVATNGACPGQEVVNVLAGTAVTWCYTVTNTGDAQVTSLVVTDNQYGIVPGSIPALSPGQSATLSLNVPASADITVTASAAGTVPVTGTPVQSPQDPAVVNVVSPDIDIDVTISTSGACPGADSVTVAAGTSVVHCYTVTNNGDDALTDVVISDPGGNVLGALPSLDSGASSTLTGASTPVQGDATVTATASGTDAYGFPVTDTDTALLDALFAKVAIQKTVSVNGTCPGSELVTVLSGTHVTSCYLVTNAGDTALTGISVHDNGVVIAAGDLAPGQSKPVSSSVVVTVDQNTAATATGLNAATDQPVTSAPDDAAVDVVSPALSIQKTASLDGACPGAETVVVLAGAPVTYCYAVTNTGDTTIGDILITDSGVTLPIGTLASGATAGASSAVTAPANDVNTAATASGTDTATWTSVAGPPDGALIDVIHPALTIATTVSLDGTCPGQEVVNVLAGTAATWCYLVKNTGDVAVNGVTVTDATYGAVPGGSATLAAGSSVTLSRAATASVDVNLVASAAGVDAAIGSLVQSNQDPAVVNVVNPSIDIDVTVSAGGACPGQDAITVPAGASVVNCYLVSNLGDDTLTNVAIKDGANHLLATIATLPAGSSSSFSQPAAVISQDTSVPGTATATDQYGFPVTDADTALIHAVFANLHLVKTAPATVNAGSSGAPIAYAITVSNLGQATAVSPVVTDALPAGTTFVSAGSSSGACSFAGGTVTCALASLAPSATAAITVNVTTTSPGGSITNTAVVTSKTPDSDTSDNSSSATTRIAGQGATRTLGFYSNHPSFVQSCLAANGGVINLGFITLRDEKFDNEIDSLHGPDSDTRVETGMAMAMGILNANVAKYTNKAARPALEQSKMQAAKQLLTAICNANYLGTTPSFNITAAMQTLAGSDAQAILAMGSHADAFNNSGDSVALTVPTGAANSKYPWDDPTDPND
jgi:uncharacterized repeat protein (TIGR01451 family)